MAASSACIVGNCLSTKRYTCKQLHGKQFKISPSLPSLHKVPKTVVRSSLDNDQHQGRMGFLKLLATPALLSSNKAFAEEQDVSNSRMSYSRFLEYLDKDRVNKVDLFENGTIAIVETVSWETGFREFGSSSRVSAKNFFKS
ncbi:hypothetical protein L1987_12661 [Smallanthus sonchifolius]|uniref:Uncharacterized protein n=1 Tax=Smallanthus sonchifolius TaxID=185202 RepID=A0ACB9JH05_9ASTR|nr:hypothetical protein L1987_12661 [Smallanthus sonchifolius]